jgi:hypothetical protein
MHVCVVLEQYAKTAVDQNEYGKYGIIKEEHYFQKQRCVCVSIMCLCVCICIVVLKYI